MFNLKLTHTKNAKMKQLHILSITTLGIAAIAHGQTLFIESFNYTPGKLETVSAGSAVSGLDSTGWIAGTGVQAVEVRDYTWSTWTNVSGITNKAMGGTFDGQYTAKEATRLLASSVASDPTVSKSYYFSYTFTPDADYNAFNQIGWANWMLEDNTTSTSASAATNFFLNWRPDSGKIGIQSDNTINGDGYSTTAMAGGSDYFIVGKVTFNDGADEASLSVFGAGADVSSVLGDNFETSNAFTATSDLTNFTFRINNQTQFGNFRMGETLGDVGVVPEPSSYVLALGALSMAFVLYRRRRART